jgi:hypothetical protein
MTRSTVITTTTRYKLCAADGRTIELVSDNTHALHEPNAEEPVSPDLLAALVDADELQAITNDNHAPRADRELARAALEHKVKQSSPVSTTGILIASLVVGIALAGIGYATYLMCTLPKLGDPEDFAVGDDWLHLLLPPAWFLGSLVVLHTGLAIPKLTEKQRTEIITAVAIAALLIVACVRGLPPEPIG